MVRHRPLAVVVLAVGVCGALAGCTRDEQIATVDPTSPATSVPPTLPAPPTAAPAATTVPVTAATTVAAATAAPSTTPATTAAPTTPAPTTAAPTTPPPTTAPALPTTETVTIHAGAMPLGVWTGAAWQHTEWTPDLVPSLTATIASVVLTGLGLPAPVTGATLGEPDYFCVGDEMSPTVVPPPGFAAGNAAYIAVTADWNVQPRPVTQVGLDSPEYQTLGESLVDVGEGADPTLGDVTQVVRADLDGDGIEEVLFTFEHQVDESGFGAAGDYTLIVVRYPQADGTVDDTVLWSYYEHDPVDAVNPGTGALLAVADLNGDGVMEVATEHTYWETGLIDIHALVDGRLTVVTGGGCGV